MCLCVPSSSLYICIWYTGVQFNDNLSEEDLCVCVCLSVHVYVCMCVHACVYMCICSVVQYI